MFSHNELENENALHDFSFDFDGPFGVNKKHKIVRTLLDVQPNEHTYVSISTKLQEATSKK